ncbi:MAG TPA: aldo/keto reductase [Bryobacteraceae bacterium]|nr:aldo/keto reductase [Bryobacteraceae bacterium]
MRVTTVGMGCMITSDATVVTRAADMGINYFDTSRNYTNGQNERMVGAALGARRKNIFLASKCDRTDGASILQELDTSLKELGTDYLDVWHLHGKSSPQQISDDMVEAQMKAKQAGKVRFIGVSCHQNLPAIVDRCIEAKMDVVQAQYSFAQDASWTPAVEKLAQAGIGVIAMKVMARAGGRGRGQQAPPKPPNYGAAALRWAIKNPNIGTTVPSMTDQDQLQENFTAMAAPFSDADSKLLVARLEEIRPYYCRTCGQCDGQCRKGLPVPQMVRFVMYADGYGQFALGRQNFQTLAQEHQDVRCSDCATCAVQCPHGVQVAQQLARAQELFA